jgi:hypothetical protein
MGTLEPFPLTQNRHGRACPGHLDAEGTTFQQNTLGIARALLIEITGTSPVMTSVGAGTRTAKLSGACRCGS